MATLRNVEIEIDPDFKIHTSYYNDFFLLRTKVLVDGKNAEIWSIKEGKHEGPVLNFFHSGSTISTKIFLIVKNVSPILLRYGVYHVDTYYYEQSLLFHTVFSSESCLKNFIFVIEDVTSALEQKLQTFFVHRLKSVLELETHSPPQQISVKIQLDLFLVSPNQQVRRGAELNLVTAENYSTFVTRWRDSKLFEFGSLYQEEGMYVCQYISLILNTYKATVLIKVRQIT